MNKVLIVILVLGAGALLYYLFRNNISNLLPRVDIDENADVELVEEGLKKKVKELYTEALMISQTLVTISII